MFECELDPPALAGLLEKASEIDHDVVHAFAQCAACVANRKGLGKAPVDLREDCWIV